MFIWSPVRNHMNTTPRYCSMTEAQELEVSGEESDDETANSSSATSRRLRHQKLALSKTKLKKLAREEQDRQQKLLVVQAFHRFYESQYGDRWSKIFRALQEKPRAACLVNKFADMAVFEETMKGVANLRRLSFVSVPLYECDDRFPHPERDDRNVYTYYMLDAASVLATEALRLAPDDNVLDLCAAPGGKSVAILQHLNLPVGSLTANEVSNDRRRRLWKVITDYLPEDLRQHVSVTGRDGTQWSQPNSFDKVLVDAPCSSERHLLQNHEELSKWSEHRTVHCSKRQLALLNAALKNVCIGGLVVYSTCSISNVENDKVIEKALRKKKIDFEVVNDSWLLGEKTEYGWIVLPDTSDGWGPLYFCVLRRLA
ncbi:hypothetical protein KP509_19G013900 [Ceratopteris richardii]|uniref:NOL1/NOP2/Sun domain family member 4 n=1 Tax=Ceratopteris richardii TaxID=49495 RepID=A0A8T2SJX2_CERRI|nr:hypothetical protein KP509_19G013900 [Ceratopteris richardii]